MKKILFLCYYFPPMGMGGTQRSAKFVKYLPRFGWEPHVVSVKEVQYYAHDYSVLDELKNSTIIRTESWDPLRLLARFSRGSSKKRSDTESKNSRISKAWLNYLNQFIAAWLLIPDSKILWLPFAIYSSIKEIRRQKIRIIYTTSPPHSAHLGGLIISKMTGAKWIADFRDDWTGGESQPSPTVFHEFINRLLEKIVLKKADRVVAICEHLKNSLHSKHGYGVRESKFVTIMNGYDRDDFSSLLNVSRFEHFTITHCGSISRVSNPEPFLKALRNLFDDMPALRSKIQVKFIGTDIFHSLETLLQNLGLKEIIPAIQYLPHHEALEHMMKSHVLLLTIFKKSDEEIITGKVFEYLAAGKSILLISSHGEVANMVERHARGTVVANNDIQGIQNEILKYFRRYEKNELPFAPPLSLAEYDRENLTENLAILFDEASVDYCIDNEI